MLPFTAERSQADGLQEEYSDLSALDQTGETSLTRQEFKEDSDINTILAKYGAFSPRQVAFGTTTDYNLDLQQAYAAIDEARQAYSQMPAELKKRYTNWQSFLAGLDNGEIILHTEQPPNPAPTPVPPTP